jgi:hypothetical protein
MLKHCALFAPFGKIYSCGHSELFFISVSCLSGTNCKAPLKESDWATEDGVLLFVSFVVLWIESGVPVSSLPLQPHSLSFLLLVCFSNTVLL